MNGSVIVVIVLVILIGWYICHHSREGLSGFGVTSSLAFNDRLAYCDPGQKYPGAAYSGGCFLPHRVII